MPLHSDAESAEVHTPFRWIVTNAAQRAALSVVAGDVNKLLFQQDTQEVYALGNHSPITWVDLTRISRLVPGGGSTGQVLTRTLSGFTWQGVPAELPSLGSNGQVLTVSGGSAAWSNLPAPVAELPSGGNAGQVLKRNSSNDGVEWADDITGSGGSSLPAGGTTGQVLKKNSNADGDAGWAEDLQGSGGGGGSVDHTFIPGWRPMVDPVPYNAATVYSEGQLVYRFFDSPDDGYVIDFWQVLEGGTTGAQLIDRGAGENYRNGFLIRVPLSGVASLPTTASSFVWNKVTPYVWILEQLVTNVGTNNFITAVNVSPPLVWNAIENPTVCGLSQVESTSAIDHAVGRLIENAYGAMLVKRGALGSASLATKLGMVGVCLCGNGQQAFLSARLDRHCPISIPWLMYKPAGIGYPYIVHPSTIPAYGRLVGVTTEARLQLTDRFGSTPSNYEAEWQYTQLDSLQVMPVLNLA